MLRLKLIYVSKRGPWSQLQGVIGKYNVDNVPYVVKSATSVCAYRVHVPYSPSKYRNKYKMKTHFTNFFYPITHSGQNHSYDYYCPCVRTSHEWIVVYVEIWQPTYRHTDMVQHEVTRTSLLDGMVHRNDGKYNFTVTLISIYIRIIYILLRQCFQTGTFT